MTQPPEIAQAEDAIQKNDFTGAETLLKKALDKDPKNYQAWFDLGFVLNRLGRVEDSILPTASRSRPSLMFLNRTSTSA